MLKHRNEQIQAFVRVLDTLICIVAFFAAYWLRSYSPFFEGRLEPIDSLTWMLAASLILHFVFYPYFGFYQSLRLKSVSNILVMVFRVFLVEFFVLGSLIFLFQAKTTSRYFFGFFLAINYGFILLEKLGARILLSSVRRRGYNYRQVLVVGTGQNAARVVSVLKRNRHWGFVPFGLLKEPKGQKLAEGLEDIPQLGDLKDLGKIVRERAVDEVYFALDYVDPVEMSEHVQLCECLGIPARFSLAMFELDHCRVTFGTIDHLPVLTYYTTLLTPAQALVKRMMDIVISLVGLVITAGLYPWIAWRIRKESPGPVIFKQVRIGENGRRFKCYKFRTMFMDAELRKQELLATNQMDGPIFKLKDDPRVTSFGAFLRRTSLDELPQFFNILRGDMSVVGTRPPTPDEVSKYETHYRRRLSIRPGLTGLWQVSGRNEISRFDDILALDLKYIDQWSLWLDLRIIFRTLMVAMFGKGAY